MQGVINTAARLVTTISLQTFASSVDRFLLLLDWDPQYEQHRISMEYKRKLNIIESAKVGKYE